MKIRNWLQGQAILNAQIQQLESQGASPEQIDALREQAATQGLRMAHNAAGLLAIAMQEQSTNVGAGKPLASLLTQEPEPPDDIIPPESIQDYFNSNDSFTDIMETWGLISTGGGLFTSGLGYYISQYVTWNTVSLLFGVALLEPSFLGEVVFLGGLAIAAIGLVVASYAYDVGNINDALVSTGAYYEGGSIIANVDGAVITSASGDVETVNTILPFSAQLNLSLWAASNSNVVVEQSP
ncbi:MAG TPA: hypothetical protein VNJ29_02260 [Candidatus Nitrosotenuis sp.]|nr:hypothetical protein [Candidatus Nitrosotenuis sp.]